MITYISGPISGAPEIPIEVKKERFNQMEVWLGCQGDVERVLNPLKTGNKRCLGNCNPEGHIGQDGVDHSWECYMKHDLIDVLEADAIVMLPEWEKSPGAILELNLAVALRHRTFLSYKPMMDLGAEEPFNWMISEVYYNNNGISIPSRRARP